jgi:hypothetical protein
MLLFSFFLADLKAKWAILAISSSEYSNKSDAAFFINFFSLKYAPPVSSLKTTKSIPSIISCFKGDEFNNVGYVLIGLTFVKDPILFLILIHLEKDAMQCLDYYRARIANCTKQYCICI